MPRTDTNTGREPRFRDANVLRMFPSFVWKAEIAPEVHRPLNQAILRQLAEMSAPLAELEPGQSWQSEHRLHRLDAFRELVDAIDAAAALVLEYLHVGHRDIRITGCWANLSAPAARHAIHSHPNNYLSGVYYVRTDDGANTINFHDPRPQTGIIRPPVQRLTADNADLVVVTVTDGTLLLFPAWLPHSVDPNRSQIMRISISFNLMLWSDEATGGEPLWQAHGLSRVAT